MAAPGYLAWVLLGLPIALGGCFLAPWSVERPAPGAFSGPAVYVEGCATCHADVAKPYAESVHTAMGIRCGQCHGGSNHPDFTQPVGDAKCGACHQPQFQQTLASKHFATRTPRVLDSDRAARATLRREGFTAPRDGGRSFVGDANAGEQGGRLCATCHYDEHRLGLGVVQRESFCVSCHALRDGHFPIPTAAATNRCLSCHVRLGESVTGQVVNTHRFAVPGAGQ